MTARMGSPSIVHSGILIDHSTIRSDRGPAEQVVRFHISSWGFALTLDVPASYLYRVVCLLNRRRRTLNADDTTLSRQGTPPPSGRPEFRSRTNEGGEKGSAILDPCLIGLGSPDIEIAVVGLQTYDYYESAHRGANNSF
jgi:hypothetical protein